MLLKLVANTVVLSNMADPSKRIVSGHDVALLLMAGIRGNCSSESNKPLMDPFWMFSGYTTSHFYNLHALCTVIPLQIALSGVDDIQRKYYNQRPIYRQLAFLFDKIPFYKARITAI